MNNDEEARVDWVAVADELCAKRGLKGPNGPLPQCPFELAERAELAAAAIYTKLSRRFVLQPGMRAFFGLMAAEEDAHARRIREFAREWQELGCGDGPFVDKKRLASLVLHAERLCEALEVVDSVDEATAFSMAASMENDFAMAHAEVLACGCHPLLAALFESLAENDQAHAKLCAEKGATTAAEKAS